MGWILRGAPIYQYFIALGKLVYFPQGSLSYYEVSLWIHALVWKHSCVLYSCSYAGCSLCELSASFIFWPASVSHLSMCIEGKANHTDPLLSTDIDGKMLYQVVLFSTLFYTWAVAKWRVPPLPSMPHLEKRACPCGASSLSLSLKSSCCCLFSSGHKCSHQFVHVSYVMCYLDFL